MTTRLPPRRSARSRSRRTVSSSAHCKSSSTIKSGLAPWHPVRNSKIARNRCSRSWSAGTSRGWATPRSFCLRPGTSWASRGPLAPTASCIGLAAALATAAVSASRKEASGATSCPVERHPDVEALLLAADEAIAGGQGRSLRGSHDPCHIVQAEAVRESLELVTATIVELHLRDGTHQVPYDFGDQDLAALGLAGHARGHVDGGAEDVARLLDHLAGVETDADLELALRILLAVFGDSALNRDGAFDCMPARPEADHDSVAKAFDAATRMLCDLLLDDRFVRLHDLVREREASARKHLGRALDVGEHDRHRALALAGRKTADDGLGCERLRGVHRLPESLGHRPQESGVGPEAGFALRVLDQLEQARLDRLAQLARRRLLAQPVRLGVIAGLQLRALESLGDGRGQPKVEAPARSEAFDDRLDPS